ASVGMLAAGVAHEINNPLMAVLGNLQLGLDACAAGVPIDPQPDLLDSLRDAFDAGQRIETIVRDLRLFSSADEERSTLVDVRSVLDSTVRMARNEIRHRAEIVKDYRPVPLVRANESRLGQVLLNLLINAVQSIPEGHSDSNEIRVATSLDLSGRVCLEVSDTGCGISEEVARRLFTPFATTKPVGVGTGLGLAICQRIVMGMGGTITYETRRGENHGTTFRVLLTAEAPVHATERSLLPLRAALRRGRVMVIDDEASLGMLVCRALSRDHDVSCYLDARNALTQLDADPGVDVILCDLMMPLMTGVEFYEQLNQRRPEHVPRVVFMTGGAFTPGTRAFLESIPNQYVAKPLDITLLRAIVNERIVT
ncbi:MAG: hypothetical protein RL701_2568, partial [Pseudomonadota bacterium]